MTTSPDLDKLSPALLNAQKAIRWATKDSTNPHFKNSYADLRSVIEAVKGPLNDNGLTFTQTPTWHAQDARLLLTTRIMHTSGQFIEDTAACPLPKADPQGYGSALTYLRRYALGAICGLFSADDDGEAARPAEPIKPETKKAISVLCTDGDVATKLQKALDKKGISTLDELTDEQGQSLLKWLTN